MLTTTKKILIVIALIILSITIPLLIFYFSRKKDNFVTTQYYKNYKEAEKKLTYSLKHRELKDRINIPIYYINLDKSFDRNYLMTKQFEKHGITNFQRIPAVYGKKFHNKKKGRLNNGYNFVNEFTTLNLSEIGCTLSHMLAIKQAYENGDKMALIMEDDVSLGLMPFWENDLKYYLDKDDWDIIQLSNSSCDHDTLNDFTDFSYDCYGTFVYVIKRSGMENILNEFFPKKTIYLKPSKSGKNTTGGTSDVFIYKNAGVSKMINVPLFFTIDLLTNIHESQENDKLALEQSTRSIDFYNDSYNIINKLNLEFGEQYSELIKRFIKEGKHIDKVIYINLDHRKDRKKRFENTMKSIGMNLDKDVIRIPAIYDQNNGAVGCLKSHIKALEYAISSFEGQNILICEDDIVLNDSIEDLNLHNLLNRIFENNLFKNTDVILLAHNTLLKKETKDNDTKNEILDTIRDKYSDYEILKDIDTEEVLDIVKDDKNNETKNNKIIKLLNSQTASCYLSNTDYLKKILEVFNLALETYTKSETGWNDNFCTDQSWKILQKSDNWYGFTTSPFKQGESYSDIEKTTVDYGM